jgi:hypothetical protein
MVAGAAGNIAVSVVGWFGLMFMIYSCLGFLIEQTD